MSLRIESVCGHEIVLVYEIALAMASVRDQHNKPFSNDVITLNESIVIGFYCCYSYYNTPKINKKRHIRNPTDAHVLHTYKRNVYRRVKM